MRTARLVRLLACSGWLCSAGSASSADFAFRGSFSADDDIRLFCFTTEGASAAVLRTFGYAGGTQADATIVAAGGFDPVIEVFDVEGVRIDGNDDGTHLEVATDPLTDSAFDAYLESSSGAGSYTVALVQYDNHALGPMLAHGFARAGSPAFAAEYACGQGQFCDQTGEDRTSFWALDIGGVTQASSGACSFGPPDADDDGVPDDADNCPDLPNLSQADDDDDQVGDACDNCSATPNPRVSASWLAANPWAVLSGGQRDDDSDGCGNLCDAKFPGTIGANVGVLDLAQFRASSGKSREQLDCGSANALPCAIFDLDEGTGSTINSLDLGRLRALSGAPPGPTCPSCPLACAAGALRSCTP